VIGTNADVQLRAGEREPWIKYSAGLIPSRHPHSLDARESDFGVVIFVEPETLEGRAITEQYLRQGIADVGSDELLAAAHEFFTAWRERRDDAHVTEACRNVVRALSGKTQPSVVTDQRILSAIDYIQNHLDGSITLEAVAGHACLSPSRFRHLFVEQTGVGLRTYVLWRRFLRVWEVMTAGESLSSAAHSAGFADAAHLTRTSKRMFGFAPSAMKLTDSPSFRTPVTLP
jgi:AraC-like DNA-binding protein